MAASPMTSAHGRCARSTWAAAVLFVSPIWKWAPQPPAGCAGAGYHAGKVPRPIPTWYFALVVIRRGDRFLLVRERRYGQRWFLPAGGVEPGETLVEGAVREIPEESGVLVELDGVLRVEHSPRSRGTARCRVFFTAHPGGDTPPLSAPNEHSLEARWVTLSEMEWLVLRHPEVPDAIAYVAAGGAVSRTSCAA